MERRTFMTYSMLSALSLAAKSSLATYKDCNNKGCALGISSDEFKPHARYQKAHNLCWAAVIESIFSWYGYKLDQLAVVQQVFGMVANVPSGPGLPAHLNRDYITGNGKKVSIKSKIYFPEMGLTEIDNLDVIAALEAGKPCVYVTPTHMMTLIGISFQTLGGNQVKVLQARLMDPFYVGNFRNALPVELVSIPQGQLRFLAIPTLST